MSYKPFYIPCSCHDIQHLILINIYKGKCPYKQIIEKDISICFNVNPKSLYEKIKYIWYIVIGKDIMVNDISLLDDQVDILREAINYYDEDAEEDK